MSDFTTNVMLGEEIDLDAAEQDVINATSQLDGTGETKPENAEATGGNAQGQVSAETEAGISEKPFDAVQSGGPERSVRSERPGELAELQRQFVESGQSNYHSGISDLIARAGDKDRYIQQLQAVMAAERRTAQLGQSGSTASNGSDAPIEITADDLVDNPQEVISRLVNEKVQQRLQSDGYITYGQLSEQLDDQKALDFAVNTADFKSLEPSMKRIAQQIPSVQSMPLSESFQLLYWLAKSGTQAGAEQQRRVEWADQDKKARASTSGGRSYLSQRASGFVPTANEMSKMNLQELEDELGFTAD